MNNRDKRKFKKRKAREKSKKNKPAKKTYRFRLDALIDGKWKGVDGYSTKEQVDAYVAAIEKIRVEGQDRIFPGRIYDAKKARFIKHIEGFDPLDISSTTMDDVRNIKGEWGATPFPSLDEDGRAKEGPTGAQG